MILSICTIAGTTMSVAPNGGWTQLFNQITGVGSADFSHSRGQVWWKECSAEPASYSATDTIAGDGWTTNIMAFRGHRQGTPIDSNNWARSVSGNAVNCPAVTLSASGGALVAIAFKYSALITGWNAGSFTNAGSSIITHTVDAPNLCAAYNLGPWAAGNTGIVDISAQDTDSAPSWAGFTLGIIASAPPVTSGPIIGSRAMMGVGK